ncbi:EamA family transporter [Phyllobacterium phragmitis]|uniref:EamA family transporter n=1 Tax=Phyllobacterium phragmitis TaxID=2670329 RepID=A0A2S9IJL5_9HYPH|nr:DMT family transporter [Phyllobacterium phragmitis]PRD40720.1 EamA family transporter [Phyllobacterium phragmitis]
MPEKMQPHVKGMVVMMGAMLILPMMDAVGKWLAVADNLPPATVSFARFLIQTLLTLTILWAAGGLKVLKSRNLGGNLIRGVLMGVASLCFFTAIKYMPLADAMAIFFVEPLMLTLLSALILKEKVGWRRLTAVSVGFIGTLIVIQPSWELFGWISLLPLGTAVLFAVYLIMNRKYAVDDSAMVMQLYAGVGGAATTALVMVAGEYLDIADMRLGLPVTSSPWALLFAIGALATVGHLLVVQAFRLAPASVLAPFQYFEIVMAVLIGLLVFNDFPTPSKWLGILIIVGSGIYVFMRERGRTAEAEALV